jgi:hypothetical protein
MRGYLRTDPRADRRAWGILAGRSRANQHAHRRHTQTAVEMAASWKPQTGFHNALEISRGREIPTFPQADDCFLWRKRRRTQETSTGARLIWPRPLDKGR